MTKHFYLVPNIDSDSVDGARTHKKLISTIHGATLPPDAPLELLLLRSGEKERG